MQRIEIIGNLAKDAVRVEGQNGGNPFMSLTVICNDRRGDAEYKNAYEVTAPVSGVLDFLKKGKYYVTGSAGEHGIASALRHFGII